MEKIYVPIWCRPLLNVKEASAYFGLGEKKIRQLTNGDNNPFALWNGSKRMIRRPELEEYLSGEYSI